MNLRFVFITLNLIITLLQVYPQIVDQDPRLVEVIESIAENNGGEEASHDFVEHLHFLMSHPLNINKVTYGQLIRLGLLSELQIQSFLKYRKQFGPLLSVYELQAIEHFTTQDILQILPYIKVKDEGKNAPDRPKDLITKGNNKIFIRIKNPVEKPVGYNEDNIASPYLGSPLKLYIRYGYRYKSKLQMGITGEKDHGEEFFKGTQKKGFDFYSGYLMVNDIKCIKTIVIGDYIPRFGQGLIMWNGFGLGKSALVMHIKKQGAALKKYSSLNEQDYFRGIALNCSLSNWSFIPFFSFKHIDANFIEKDGNSKKKISSFKKTGFHRTIEEIKDKHTVKQLTAGGHVSYQVSSGKIGITCVTTHFNHSVIEPEKGYRQYSFSGDEETNVGFDYSLLYRNMLFFGEFASRFKMGFAALNGVIISLSEHVDISMLYRNFQKDYHALYSDAFGERSEVSNEKGLYTGIALKPMKFIVLSAYLDIYRHPWMKYLVSAPSRGVDYFYLINYKPSKSFECYVRYKHEVKQQNSSENTEPVNTLEDIHKSGTRIHTTYNVSRNITLKNRISFVNFIDTDKQREKGFMAYQEISFHKIGSPISLSARFTIFDMDSWNAREYVYERDVLYAFSVPALYNCGSRLYILINYKIFKWLIMWVRLAQTYQANTDRFSPADTRAMILGHTKTEIKYQMRLTF